MEDTSLNGPRLNRFDCICIIVGTIIGAGIFKTPSVIASHVPSVFWLFVVWIIGGIIALIGALCFAELTTTYPDKGGDYGYLKRAYHRRAGFAFSWCAFWVIRPCNIGTMAVICGEFAFAAFPNVMPLESGLVVRFSNLTQVPPELGVRLFYGSLAVLGITIINLLGIVIGKTTQNVLTVLKVVGILLVIGAALLTWSGHLGDGPNPELTTSANVPATAEPTDSDSEPASGFSWFWLCMVFVMFTFGGWNDIAFVATEVRDPKRNLFWSLVTGTGLILAIYLLFNVSLLIGLGFQELQAIGREYGNAPAVLMERNLGLFGKRFVSLLVCISCLGAMSAMIFTSPRIYWATGADYPKLSWLAGDRRSRGWWRAMALQAAVTMLFIFTFGRKADGFDTLAVANAPYFWFFLGLTVVGLIVLRLRTTEKFEGYQIPGYPWLPLIFFSACIFMTYRAVEYMFARGLQYEALFIGFWVLLGVAISFLFDAKRNAAEGE